MTIGIGIGVEKFPFGAAAAAGAAPVVGINPADISNAIVGIDTAVSYAGADAGDHVITGVSPVNLVDGGTTIVEVNTNNQPYIHRVAWPSTRAEPTIALPNGHSFFSTNDAFDTGLATRHLIRHDMVSAPPAAGDSWTVIVVLYHVSYSSSWHRILGDPASNMFMNYLPSSGRVDIKTPSKTAMITAGMEDWTQNAWHVLAYQHSPNSYSHWIDGIQQTVVPENVTGLGGSEDCSVLWGVDSGGTICTAELWVYNDAVSHENINGAGAWLANKYDISYLWTPIPPE